MNFENVEIRNAITNAKLRHSDIASEIHVTKTSFSRMMGRPLSEKRKADILKALETLTTLTKDR